MILRLSAVLLVVYLFVMALIYTFQRDLMYFPSGTPSSQAAMGVPMMQTVMLTTSDHLSLKAWYQAAKPGMSTLVYFHGNSGNFTQRAGSIRDYLALGYGVLLPEYRGFGGNPGTPTEQGLYRDAAAAMAFLKKQSVATSCVILFGESLGTAVAVEMAARYSVGAVVLQAPFTSMTDMAKEHYPLFGFASLVRDKFDSASKIATVQAPILFLHGDQDTVVPIRYGKALYQRAKAPKIFREYPQKRHNNLFNAQMLKDVVDFFAENLPERCRKRAA